MFRKPSSHLLLDSAVMEKHKQQTKLLTPVHIGRSCIKCGTMVTNISKKKYGQRMYPQWYRVGLTTFQCSKCYNKEYWAKTHPNITVGELGDILMERTVN